MREKTKSKQTYYKQSSDIPGTGMLNFKFDKCTKRDLHSFLDAFGVPYEAKEETNQKLITKCKQAQRKENHKRCMYIIIAKLHH